LQPREREAQDLTIGINAGPARSRRAMYASPDIGVSFLTGGGTVEGLDCV
jgi:hypothetical protein